MDRVQRIRAREIFGIARELAPDAREEMFRSLAPEEVSLRPVVEEMLASLDEAGDFLRDATVPVPSRTVPSEDESGGHIGAYKLLQVIGEGGFGVVHMAEQEHPVRRRVALKIIKLGMDTKQVIARFEAERQALAMLDHPGIARVFDAGATPLGRPYFVMELVKGQPITEFCDAQRLAVPERLELFRGVCEAVQHAHQRGIIHRDLKPGNVLVGLSDVGGGKPVAKIIDFGIAKAIDQRLTDRTLFTELRQMVGTPEYMSPEQAEMNAVDIDTRSDVYSLGVLLYELLTGVTPLDARTLRSAAFAQMQALIRETDPPKPSTRVRTMSAPASSSRSETVAPASASPRIREIAERRRTEPRTLSSGLRGELDWIVMKAMEKDRTRRYPTAISFSDDIARHLAHQPVQAGPPSRVYRFQRMVRRNRGAFAAGAAVLAALVLGLVASLVGFVTASHERDEAQRHRVAAEKLAYTSTLFAAAAALEKADATGAHRSLELAPASLRGWEWKHLAWRSDQSLASFTPVGAGAPCVLRLLGSGRRAILQQTDHPVALVDLDNGAVLRTFPEPIGADVVVSVSPDSEQALLSKPRGPMVMWNIETGVERWRRQSGHESGKCSFSSDGKQVAVLHVESSAILLLNAGTGEEARRLTPPTPPLNAPQFYNNGRSLRYIVGVPGAHTSHADLDLVSGHTETTYVTLGHDTNRFWHSGSNAPNEIWITDYSTAPARVIRVPCNSSLISQIELSHDGAMLALGETSGAIRILDVRDPSQPEPIGTLIGHTREIASLAFTPDGARVVSSDAIGCIKVWAARSGSGPPAQARERGAFTQALSPDGEIAFGGAWGLVNARDTQCGARLWSRHVSRSYIVASCFSPDGDRIIFADMQALRSQVFVVDARTGADLRPAFQLPAVISSIACTTDGQRLLTGGADGRVRLVDLTTASVLKEAPGPRNCIRAIVIDPEGTRAFTCSGRKPSEAVNANSYDASPDDHEIWIWNISSLKHTQRLGDRRSPVTALALGPDSHQLLAACADGSVSCWLESADGRWTRSWTTPVASDPIVSLALSVHAERIAAISNEGSVILLDLATGERLIDLAAAPGVARAACFTADARALVLSSSRSDCQVFETGPPACGLLERDALAAASAVVDRLRDQLWTRDRILAHLHSLEDKAEKKSGTPPGVLAAAINDAQTRADAANYLNSEALLAVMPRNPDPAGIARAVAIMESVCSESPDSHAFLNTLATAYYRAGRYDDCLSSVSRCQKLRESDRRPVNPGDLLLHVMATFRRDGSLGPADIDAFARAKREIDVQSLRGDYEIENLLIEAAQLIEK